MPGVVCEISHTRYGWRKVITLPSWVHRSQPLGQAGSLDCLDSALLFAKLGLAIRTHGRLRRRIPYDHS